MDVPEAIREKLQKLPDKPGVYLMRDARGRVIYVGKARSLRKRVQTYFRQATMKSADPKLRGLLKSAADLDVLELRTEEEATLTEGRMIKEYRPRYNVAFRDDKRFLLLKIDRDEPFPRYSLCRIRKEDGGTYFGPYASAASAREAQAFVEKHYGLRPCRPRIPGEVDYKHCINDIVRFCSAPCIKKISSEDYHERVDEACAFLRGERRNVLKELEKEMEAVAAEQDFERAAAIRDTLLLLRKALKQRVSGTKSLSVRAREALEGVREIGEALGLAATPRVIECYDISNISGTHAVGSMVCAVDGVPAKNRYRLFRIKTVAGIDDPGMMAEVIRRRFARAVEENSGLPDLVIVDGGITQLRAARDELNSLGLAKLPLTGLAKRFEELHYEDKGKRPPFRFAPDAHALKVLKRIRDEAHRFALTYHRTLRSKRIQESVLDEIPGIGKKRKQVILRHFGSIARLRKATVDDLVAVPGIGPDMAVLIHAEMRGREEDRHAS